MTRLSADECHHIRVHVGSKLRYQREAAGLSLAALAGRLGVDPAVVEEIEVGARDVEAVLLVQAAIVLHVPVSAFFDKLTETLAQLHIADPDLCARDRADEAFALVKHFTTIANPCVRATLLRLVCTQAAIAEDPGMAHPDLVSP